MSRTYKDKKELKAKRRIGAPSFKQRYRNYLLNGSVDDLDCEICPDCGAETVYERGFISCEECGWGSLVPIDDAIQEMGSQEFSNVA